MRKKESQKPNDLEKESAIVPITLDFKIYYESQLKTQNDYVLKIDIQINESGAQDLIL